MCAPELRTRKNLSAYKHAVLDALRANGFKIEDHHVKARDENRFFAIDLEYETAFPREDALRPHIQIEMTARDIQLPHLVLTPKKNGGGMDIDLHGSLAGILTVASKHQDRAKRAEIIQQVMSVAEGCDRHALDMQDKMVAGVATE